MLPEEESTKETQGSSPHSQACCSGAAGRSHSKEPKLERTTTEADSLSCIVFHGTAMETQPVEMTTALRLKTGIGREGVSGVTYPA
jgi:hypothetical protein